MVIFFADKLSAFFPDTFEQSNDDDDEMYHSDLGTIDDSEGRDDEAAIDVEKGTGDREREREEESECTEPEVDASDGEEAEATAEYDEESMTAVDFFRAKTSRFDIKTAMPSFRGRALDFLRDTFTCHGFFPTHDELCERFVKEINGLNPCSVTLRVEAIIPNASTSWQTFDKRAFSLDRCRFATTTGHHTFWPLQLFLYRVECASMTEETPVDLGDLEIVYGSIPNDDDRPKYRSIFARTSEYGTNLPQSRDVLQESIRDGLWIDRNHPLLQFIALTSATELTPPVTTRHIDDTNIAVQMTLESTTCLLSQKGDSCSRTFREIKNMLNDHRENEYYMSKTMWRSLSSRFINASRLHALDGEFLWIRPCSNRSFSRKVVLHLTGLFFQA